MSAPTIVARGRSADDPASTSPRSRIRTRVVLVVSVALVAAAAVLLASLRPQSDRLPFSPLSAEPDGARATAQILGQQGVDVDFVRSTGEALEAAESGTTLLVLRPWLLRDEQMRALAGVDADVVIAGWRQQDLTPLTDRVDGDDGVGPDTTVQAGCDETDAAAAGTIVAGGTTLNPGHGDVEVCFEPAGAVGGLYATWQQDSSTWRVLADERMLTNEQLARHGNAALVLRALGEHEELTWYLPDPADPFGTEPPATGPIATPVLVQLALVGLVLVLWRGRRLGPAVVEPLPVTVRATETVRGRARLYRRAGAYGHAATALRAGLLARVAGRLGLPSHASRNQVIDTLAAASGRPHDAIADVLYGPPPQNADDLLTLTHALDILESELRSR